MEAGGGRLALLGGFAVADAPGQAARGLTEPLCCAWQRPGRTTPRRRRRRCRRRSCPASWACLHASASAGTWCARGPASAPGRPAARSRRASGSAAPCQPAPRPQEAGGALAVLAALLALAPLCCSPRYRRCCGACWCCCDRCGRCALARAFARRAAAGAAEDAEKDAQARPSRPRAPRAPTLGRACSRRGLQLRQGARVRRNGPGHDLWRVLRLAERPSARARAV